MEQRTNIVPLACDGAVTPDPDSTPCPGDSTTASFDPVSVAWRSDGWAPERQRAFIEELADCGIVCEAAARVGMTEQSARRLRRRPDAAGFNRAWDAAMHVGAERLRSIAYERAINGTIRRRYFRGELIAEDRVFDNRLLIYLLGRVSTSGDAAHRAHHWNDWMHAVEDGRAEPVPAPDQGPASPVWRDDDGLWLTSFPAPDGFDGDQWGDPGTKDYCRQLSPSEQASIDLWQVRDRKGEGSRRDRYFRRLE